MARRSIHRLSDRGVKAAKPGMHCDGGGLYLQVTEGVADEKGDRRVRRSWLFRFATGEVKTSRSGKPRPVERAMGLGSFPDISLAEARQKAADARRQRDQRIDPIETRIAERASAALARARGQTFDQCRDAYIAAHRAGWRNAKHGAQWISTLDTYVTPVFGKLPVQAIDTALVMKVLEQEVCDQPDKPGSALWAARPETASRLRGRIECILDWAKVRGYRQGENPALWRGHLDHLLPARGKVRKVKHHAAMPFIEVAAFMTQLRSRSAVAARALEFTILTAARTGEVLGARWHEIDLAAKVWTVPADRMKGGREHRVPLSAAVVAVIERMQDIRANDYVFPGDRRSQLSNMAMDMLLRRMDHDVTVHGFRSSFRDWAAERTNFAREVAEAALAHVIGDKVEAAYRRGDMFDKRRRLMTAWADFCDRRPAAGAVVPLRADASP
jgi:integrase